MHAAPIPLSARARTAVLATPIRRASNPASADPAAKATQPVEVSGPASTPARSCEPVSSARRTGISCSKTIIAMDQQISAASSASSIWSTRSSRRLSPTVRHDRRTASRVGYPRGGAASGRGRVSRIAAATRWTTFSAANTSTGSNSAVRSAIGCHQTRTPLVRAPSAIATPSAVPCADSAPSTSAPGSCAWTESTYHASSGPESSARKTPISAAAATKPQKEVASVKTTPASTLTTAATR